MRINLVKIGNSQGIRLPTTVIKQAQLTQELELEIGNGWITLSCIRRPRESWDLDAMACHAAGEDKLDNWDAATADFEGEWQ